MKPPLRFPLLLLCVLRTPFGVCAEDAELDALFDSPQQDFVQEQPAAAEIDHRSAFETAEKAVLSGSFTAIGGFAFGWTDEGERDASPLADSDTYIALDARPDPTLRLRVRGLVSLDHAGYDWQVTLDEFFCDYIFRETLFIRFGKQTISWGQGRLFSPGDLMDESESGTSLKLSLPTFLSGLSLVALVKEQYFADSSAPSYTEPVYGALADAVFAGTRASFGVRYQREAASADAVGVGFHGLLSLKKTLFSTDLFADGVFHENAGDPRWTVLGGFFREWGALKLYGEWVYDDGTADEPAHRAGLAFGWKRFLGSSFDLGFKWLHSVGSADGALLGALAFSPWKHLQLSAAIPFIYGDAYADILDEDFVLTQRFGIVLFAKLSTSF